MTSPGRRSPQGVSRSYTTRELALVGLFTALTVVGAQLRIPLPPVPVTLQLLFVLLAGMLLGPRLGAASQVIYAVLGLAGLPVFASGGGWQYVFTPGFGYLLGFVAAAAVAGAIARDAAGDVQVASLRRLMLAGAAGVAACYAVALPYFSWILNVIQSVPTPVGAVVSRGLLVFLPGDLGKVIAAALIARRIKPQIASILR